MKKYLSWLSCLGFLISLLPTVSLGQQLLTLTPFNPDCNSTFCSFYNQGVKTCTNFSKCGAMNTSLLCTGNSHCITFGSGVARCTASNHGRCKTIPFFSLNQCRFLPYSFNKLTCPNGVILILPTV